jgi:hypothetical protein
MRQVNTSDEARDGLRATAFAFLLLSLAFAAYLYPLPSDNIAQVTSTMTPAERVQVGESLESSYWASWITNLLLMLLGVSSATLWLARAQTTWRKWAALAGAAVFFLICVVVVAAQSDHGGVIAGKIALLRQLASARSWSFLAAELHRLVAMLVAFAMLIAMPLALRKGDSA